MLRHQVAYTSAWCTKYAVMRGTMEQFWEEVVTTGNCGKSVQSGYTIKLRGHPKLIRTKWPYWKGVIPYTGDVR